MKQLTLTFALVFLAGWAAAQNSAVTTAIMRMKQQKLIEAKEKINMAIDHEKTKDDPKTWYYRGRIYQGLAVSKDPKHKKAGGNKAIVTAYDSYKKAIELDTRQREYYGKSKKQLSNLYAAAVNAGIRNYKKASKLLKANKRDSAFLRLNAAIESYDVASNLKPEEKTPHLYSIYATKTIRDQQLVENSELPKYYEYFKKDLNKLLSMDQVKPEMIIEGIIYANKLEKPEERLFWIKKGREKFPKNNDIMVQEVSYYMEQGKVDVLEDKLKEAIEVNPNNVQVINALGDLYNQQGEQLKKDDKMEEAKEKFEMAMEQYKKVLEKDPDNFLANYHTGIIHYNRGARITKKVNQMDFNEYQKKNGKELEKKAKEKYKTALSFLEKAYEQDPEDRQVLISLRNTYNHLDMKEKKEKMIKELKAVGQ